MTLVMIHPNDAKFRELILYIARREEGDPRFGATKLNKLLFFSDFMAFKSFGAPITGQVYFKLDHGPAPRRMVPIKRELIDAGVCVEVERDCFGKTQKSLIATREPDLSDFSGNEIALVDRIIDECWHLNARDISGESHDFAGWQLARDQEDIPYEVVLAQTVEERPEDKVVDDELREKLVALGRTA